ncbi:MAG: hypothetical protein ACTSUX_09890 [Promethearchaeota archaeon]
MAIINCVVCKNEIKEKYVVKKISFKYIVICAECDKNFSTEELEFVINLFQAFGGHFGKFKISPRYKQKVVKELLYKENTENPANSSLKFKLNAIYRALLLGINFKEMQLTINNI